MSNKSSKWIIVATLLLHTANAVVNGDAFDISEDGRLHFVEVETRNTFRKFPTSVNNWRDRLFAFRTTIINTSVVHPIRRQLFRPIGIYREVDPNRSASYYLLHPVLRDSILRSIDRRFSIFFNDWKWIFWNGYIFHLFCVFVFRKI